MIHLTKRQKEIVVAGISIIADKGIQSLSIRNVANSVGISEPAIYRHFENKNDLLLHITHYIIDDWENVIRQNWNVDIPALDELGLIMREVVHSFAEDENVAAASYSLLLLLQKDKPILQKIQSVIELAIVRTDGILEKGQEAGEVRNGIPARELAMIIFGALRLLIERWNLSSNSFDIKAEWDLLWFALKKMIGARQ